MTELPTWAVWVLSFGSPLLAFVGVMIGPAVTRRGARELELRSKREEVMRIPRWAAEMAVSDKGGSHRSAGPVPLLVPGMSDPLPTVVMLEVGCASDYRSEA